MQSRATSAQNSSIRQDFSFLKKPKKLRKGVKNI